MMSYEQFFTEHESRYYFCPCLFGTFPIDKKFEHEFSHYCSPVPTDVSC